MAIEDLGTYNHLFNITRNTDNKTLNVDTAIVFFDLDVEFIGDAFEFLESIDSDDKSLYIRSCDLTIYPGESPIEVLNKYREKNEWFWDPMPKEIAKAQKKFEERQKNKMESNLDAPDGSEPGEKE